MIRLFSIGPVAHLLDKADKGSGEAEPGVCSCKQKAQRLKHDDQQRAPEKGRMEPTMPDRVECYKAEHAKIRQTKEHRWTAVRNEV